MSKFDTRVEQLEKLGFKDIRVGYSNEKYAFMYHQIEEITQENWDELIKIIENGTSITVKTKRTKKVK